ncbi:MAG TPA: Ig-like domain-containing protein [Paludibacter sp.]|jgi:hypothetical protein|nr:MAG: Bacterial Ig-like domain (group 2) [Bacteroidetes bacterium ADurb.Bin174]HQB27367.1 Ig-like domain-containing protein [Paludibacter sp.]
MTKNKIGSLLTCIAITMTLLLGSCDDNMPVVKEVGVESITLSEELANGITLEVGATIDISWQVTVLPENATNRAESYYSSNPEVATVNAKGRLVANAAGTSVISIMVGGKSVEFTLTVVDKIIIPAVEIKLAISTLELMLETTYNLAPQVRVLPLEANDGLDYSSSNSSIVSVNEEGILTGVSEGTAVITVASRNDPSIKDELTVTVITFSGDYPRSQWTMTASHDLFKSTNDTEKNSLLAAFDGDLTTNFCLVRPGKGFGTAPRVDVPSGEAIYFIVDMKQSQSVNYFRIRHRNTNEVFIRWYGFDQILGSNDGENFTLIASNIVIPDAANGPQQESPNIPIPRSSYRYLKFYAESAACFYQSSFTSQGSTVQIQELYLGLNP